MLGVVQEPPSGPHCESQSTCLPDGTQQAVVPSFGGPFLHIEPITRCQPTHFPNQTEVRLIESPRGGAGTIAKHEIVPIGSEQDDLALLAVIDTEQ